MWNSGLAQHRGSTMKRSLVNVLTAGKALFARHVSLVIREAILGKDPRNVTTVGRPSVRILFWLCTRGALLERNPVTLRLLTFLNSGDCVVVIFVYNSYATGTPTTRWDDGPQFAGLQQPVLSHHFWVNTLYSSKTGLPIQPYSYQATFSWGPALCQVLSVFHTFLNF